MSSEMNEQPQRVDERVTEQPSHDGLAAIAIALLTVALIAFVVIQIT